ncbi:Ig-like domain-containing protein [Paenibacillus bouchesdurhonensis]|uniref:Ig-like domain-containing protein n=1 Tax=Paenibacillus bouchesdurhonensis TaxID=1870990 RepID=UPI000DA621B7|nr:Ig-like domain-containing protein [Paenibacillus bouchesdurhonensis]
MNKSYALLKQRVVTVLLAIILLLTLPTGWASASEGEAALEWEQSYGENVSLLHVKPIRDGYAIVGVNKSNNNVYFAKTDSLGTLYWEKSFEVRGSNGKIVKFTEAVSAQDGGYLLGGTLEDFHFRYRDFYLAKIDDNGFIQWNNMFSSGAYGTFRDIHLSKEGSYLFAESTESLNTGSFSTSVGKLSSAGDMIFRKTVGGGGPAASFYQANKIHELANGGYVVEGDIQGTVRIWTLDANREVVWTNTYSGLTGGEVAVNADDGYMIAAANENDEVVFIQNDANNQEEQRQTLAVRGKVISLERTADGYLFGTTQGLYKTNMNGEVLWFQAVSDLQRVFVESDGSVLVIAKERLLKFGTSENHETPSLEYLKFDSPSYSLGLEQTLDTVVTAVYGNTSRNVTSLVHFSSDDESIASIDASGSITGHRFGQTHIRAIWSNQEAVARVYVWPSSTSLHFDSDEYSVNIGEPLDIEVTYRLGNNFTQVTHISSYSSSNPSIAYVDSEGNIIGLQRGRVTLTVTYDGLEATAIVDVY